MLSMHPLTHAKALFSHLDPSDPNVFSGMDKGMVRRILDLRDEKVWSQRP